MYFFPLTILNKELGLVEQQKKLNNSHLRQFYAGDRFGVILYIKYFGEI